MRDGQPLSVGAGFCMPRAAQIGAAHKLARRPSCYAPAFGRCLAPDERAAAYAATPIAYPATTATADSASHTARDRLGGPEGARRRRTGSAGGCERFGTMMGAATGAPSRPQRCTSGRCRAQASRRGDLLLVRWPMAEHFRQSDAAAYGQWRLTLTLEAPAVPSPPFRAPCRSSAGGRTPW